MTVDLLDRSSLSACARVSKDISEHALNSLYRTAPEFFNVLDLLCPLTSLHEDSQYLVRGFLLSSSKSG